MPISQQLAALLTGPSRAGASEAVTLLLLRVTVGSFLIWGVADNILSTVRMAEFAAFLAAHDFPAPVFMARLSVWVQAISGVGIALGLFTRWAGLLCAANFIVAIVFVDAQGGIRSAFPSMMLVVTGLHLAARGCGPFGLDRRFTPASARLL